MKIHLLATLLLITTTAWAEFHAGAAKVDITPKVWPVQLVGSFSERLADKAHDPLHARAIVCDDGQTRLAIVIVDNCLIGRNYLDRAKALAAKKTKVRPDRILVAATHTHTAPPGKDRRTNRDDAAHRAYFKQLVEGIAEAIAQAEKNLVPAEMAHGVALVPEEIFNRRWHMKPGGIAVNPFGSPNDIVRMNPPRNLIERPAGPTDPEVHFISLRSTRNSRPIALLANYSLHYVGGLPAGGVSADYFGVFAGLIEQALGADKGYVAMMSNGTSGDINNISFRVPRPRQKPMQRMNEVAQIVADRVLAAHKQVTFRKDITLAMEQTFLTLKNRQPTAKQIAYAKAVLAGTAPKPLSGLATAYAHRTLALANGPREEEIVLQALRLGEVGITSIPCEVLCEIGLTLKAKSPLPQATFTIELANGHNGYLPTPRQHTLGGYETWMGTCTLELLASVKIQKALLDMLEKVASKD
ncbi:MAG: neutral/alkaline non-lysosomal ceramidase N-terminal domain-containing protein [Verrucomicrobia subdivision 3 bacterium]|nr:neutral/alkaline non-lysosomal ceramidase N-terminal domain-containing protein [Limisphaerales bacterium]